MVYMTDLNLTMNIDCDGLPLWGSEYSRKLTETKDSDGALIKAMKIVSPITPFLVVGRFSAEYLSPNVTYTFTYMFMFDDNSESEEKVSVRCLLRLPDRKFQEHRHELNSKPRKKWIKFPIGEFKTNKGYIGEIEFSLHFQCPTKEVKFAVKGVIIEPNLFNLLRS
ncbi:lectin-like [Chenopodium quinoa]|uniref:lectin-like n=1 Tax=Chenopodium quinoa TaxID=63459 RepID=UPI000B781E17|nr:lectin-like [Chenopodium quinoa]